jgi:hypothetical protein
MVKANTERTTLSVADLFGKTDAIFKSAAAQAKSAEGFFETAKVNKQIVSKLNRCLIDDATLHSHTTSEEIKCIKCHFNNRTSCSFQLPEYNTEEAF